jgi:glycosyltransferase involved in cell wall biosynthesis
MLQLIRLFQKQGYEITFASSAQESDFSFDLRSIGISSQRIELNSGSFDTFVTALCPAVVMFDRFAIEEQFGWRVHESCPDALRILDTEDLHCLRSARQNAVRKNIEFQLPDLLSEPIAKREIASILRCDLTLIISEFEMAVLQETFKIDPGQLEYLPLFFASDENNALIPFEERKDFVFIGNFLHEPNWDAVKQLKETIWPQISKLLPEAKMNIYGAYPSQKVLQLHNPKERFFIHGRAENAEEVIKAARILVAPLRFGAGLKGKLLEAMQFGTPSITTAIGAEGISENEFWNGFVEDDDNEFVLKSVLLYQEETLWNASQKKGFEILKDKFNNTVFEDSLPLDWLLSHLNERRKQNFMGTLLWHHAALSTKYMSRWIEEKNK